MTGSPASTPTSLRATLEAAFRLARFDRSALALFDGSVAGFWQSYRAAFLIAPIELGLAVSRVPTDQDWLYTLVIEALIFAIRWMMLPLVLLAVAERIGRGDRALRFLVAYNWISIPQTVATVLGLGLGIGPGMSPAVAVLLVYGSIAYSLALAWFVIRAGLDVPSRIAALLVGLDLSINVAFEVIASILQSDVVI